MNSIFEEIRNANLDIEALKAKKNSIKKLALEHRDEFTDVKDVDKQKADIETINKEIETREQNLKTLQDNAKLENEKRSIQKMDIEKNDIETRDEFAKQFKETRKLSIKGEELRSVLLASAGIAKPTLVNGISDPFNTQISILDQVKVIDVTGAGTFKESLLKTHSAATTKSDGTAQDASDPVFGSVTLTPAMIGVTTYVSRELRKTTPLNYMAKVQESALVGLKVKLAQDIVTKIKAAQDDASVDLFQTLNASSANGMLPSTTGVIDAKTLRNIVMNYGGDANVYGNAKLYLNKTDLIAFGDVRGSNEKKSVYEITPDAVNPNTGIIKDGGLSVPYCIVPTLTALSGTAQTSSAIQTMIYGSPLNYELALFGNYEIRVSEDYKFAEGLDTVLGEVMTAGNVIAYNGFEIVTIPSNA
jgi:HK97 family phage major capsid protein